ncbi:hypothetical protein Q5H91_10585 [Sphingomonas sp. KR1UV-12]|uniref:Uncharacterized protein n=1 Tax=Sphingomonas aurea TaxID=3063994 RepID=A0ABT9ELI8_9SPHN|nr:hypothetical protein [Sphingomonas sp. KR1UV-12]MDP1027661.1 hypothetical protein [Sphingomonas sp. KR1UV-12]
MSTLLIAAMLSVAPATTDRALAFAAPALADHELARERGGFIRPGMASRRVMTDANAMSTLQLQADVNRMTFDNWFANEGAVLIVNNQLASLGR